MNLFLFFFAAGNSHAPDNSVTMYSADGSPFSLQSVDIGEYQVHIVPGYSNDILVTGYFEAGGTITIHLIPDRISDSSGGADDFETIYIDEAWNGLDYIVFDSISGFNGNYYEGWAIDNIVVNEAAIPEPSTLILCTLGLIGIIVLKRKGFLTDKLIDS